ncbi:hypothetical protein CBP51_03175 [Cellvibrio mixtus]|uniref:Uncharacterized protein n=1 Tax=Cellvibrio mixtus TaxID=39650 RepID=A0A266Q836_9GAMM|nr:hypothetical protein [Cellvibrio mixtus]OZY86047.1 hypothetical protein CBP51_03175 [Cellvibrio mixtus]
MFKSDVKKEALKALEKAQADYTDLCERAQEKAEELFKLRQSTSLELIPEVEEYVNCLANTPKDFDKSFAEYNAEFTAFNSILHELEHASKEAQIKASGAAAVGVAAGVGTAAFAPTAAMAVATTFGTASTGTAISTLSGAAASKAALAWLGGGALTSGGAGMAGGQALLALAGPVGWAIGGTAIVGAGLFARSKNGKVADQATAARKELEVHARTTQSTILEICRLLEQTRKHAKGMRKILATLKLGAPEDYNQFDLEMRQSIAALINHVNSLSMLLNKKVDVS